MVNKEIISPLLPLPPAPPPLSLYYSHQTPLTLISKSLFYFFPRVFLSLRYHTRTCHISQHNLCFKVLCFYFSAFFALVFLAGFRSFCSVAACFWNFVRTHSGKFSGYDGFP